MLTRELPLSDYESTWHAMQNFTQARLKTTPDELWILEHPPVFTLGQAAKQEHLLHPHNIPVIRSDRGGQVTYHGPGQLILYVLLDIQRLALSIRELICLLERSVITLLADYHIRAHTQIGAPGVYVDNAKICAIGLRIRKGCSYHGISLNVNMDLTPFEWINPCGYKDLKIIQLSDWVPDIQVSVISARLVTYVSQYLERHHVRKEI